MKPRTKEKLLVSLAALPGFGALSTGLAYSQIPRFPIPLSLSEQAGVLLDMYWKVLAVPALITGEALMQGQKSALIQSDYVYIGMIAVILFVSWLGLILHESAHPASVMVPIALWTLMGGGLTYAFIIAGI